MRIPKKLLMRVADTVREPRNYRHIAIVFQAGNVLAMATNESRHAEVAALSKVDPIKRIGTTVLSVRVRKDGSLANGKPCEACEAFMREYGVKKVYWSDGSGSIECIKL
jgi:cytidine deaminase